MSPSKMLGLSHCNEQTIMSHHQQHNTASLPRRFGALLYDTFIVIGLLVSGAGVAVAINRGQAISPHNQLFALYLIAIIYAYFSYSWVRGGQTIGMRAWRLKIHSLNGETVDIWRATMRFGYAIPSLLLLGAGLWWLTLDKRHLSWYDRWSGTYLAHSPHHP